MLFETHIGIDYSGRGHSRTRASGLQVYISRQDEIQRVVSPATSAGVKRNWCREEISEWLIERARLGATFVAGIDHALSFPLSYFEYYGLTDWTHFLLDFCEHWPTDTADVSVEMLRQQPIGEGRVGSNRDFRLTERWSSSAKSVFQFDVQGSVAKSTHAGIPWLRRIREEVGERIHFWPFDGWEIPTGKSAIVEVYPSILRHRYTRDDRSVDEQDAYSVARWLSDFDKRGLLPRYFDPPLTRDERKVAQLEGWIFGIT